jgi:D-glycero-alpha-D-manno-heptose 1-phosphate guanylyltransferase
MKSIPMPGDKQASDHRSDHGSPREDMKAVLLVGGMGTRLRPVVSDTPKPLAAVGSRPFLELLVCQLRNQHIRRLVMCTGYLADQIEKEFGDGHGWDLTIEYSKEESPLGTAGAVKLAQSHLKEESDFFVLNGDSFVEVDFHQLLSFHRKSGGIASMAVVRMKNDKRYGTVHADNMGRVIGFAEKAEGDESGFVNAGVYVFSRSIFDHIPAGHASLEKDVFPQLLNRGLYVFEQQGVFIDIGTPEDYARAQELRDRLYGAAVQGHQTGSNGPGRQ